MGLNRAGLLIFTIHLQRLHDCDNKKCPGGLKDLRIKGQCRLITKNFCLVYIHVGKGDLNKGLSNICFCRIIVNGTKILLF